MNLTLKFALLSSLALFLWTNNFARNPKTFNSIRSYDIVINEIMADPAPSVDLPEVEYIELYNRNEYAFQLKNFKLIIGTGSYSFPAIEIAAHQYLIITAKKDTTLFKAYGKVIGLFGSSSVLTNAGQFIALKDPDGKVISWMEYNDSWYGDTYKAQGGWSLEQIDPSNPCGGINNWKASKSKKGGTPGEQNSVFAPNPDLTMPELFHMGIPNDSVLDLYFTEPLDSSKVLMKNTYLILPENIHPAKVTSISKNYSTYRLWLPSSLSPQLPHILTMSNDVTDCAGNAFKENLNVQFWEATAPDSADVVINEVLFNAQPGGSEYIELYNNSKKAFNLKKLYIGIKDEDQKDFTLTRLSENDFILNPFSYEVICRSKGNLNLFFTVDDRLVLEPAGMNSLSDKAGTIAILNNQFKVLDIFSYSEKLHIQTLKSFEGVSLERVNPVKPAYIQGNWHSASENSSYGTPGFKNSQYLSDSISDNQIVVEEEIFSPDNDGYKDIQKISYSTNKPACRAQVYVFDSNGRLVKRLLNNVLLGTSGFFTWDGMNEGGKRCDVGMYIFFIRFLFDDGTVKEYKKTCILAVKK